MESITSTSSLVEIARVARNYDDPHDSIQYGAWLCLKPAPCFGLQGCSGTFGTIVVSNENCAVRTCGKSRCTTFARLLLARTNGELLPRHRKQEIVVRRSSGILESVGWRAIGCCVSDDSEVWVRTILDDSEQFIRKGVKFADFMSLNPTYEFLGAHLRDATWKRFVSLEPEIQKFDLERVPDADADTCE